MAFASANAGSSGGGSVWNEAGQYSPPDCSALFPMDLHALRPDFRLVIALLAILGTPGCCGFCAWMCGPDRSQWVQYDLRTPESTVASLLESVRRGDADRIYDLCTPELRSRMGVVSRVEMRIVWDRLEDEVPGLSALADGTVSPFEADGDGRLRVTISAYGETIPLVLKRMPWRWRVAATVTSASGNPIAEREDGLVRPPELSYDPEAGATRIQLPPVGTEIPLDAGDQLESVRFEREWRLDELPLNPAR